MKTIKFTVVSLLLALTALSAYAQQVQDRKIYRNIQVQKFTVAEGVEFSAENVDELTAGVIKNFEKTRRFESVSAFTEAANNEGNTLIVSGEVIKYEKGSRAKRYFLGPGFGATKIIAQVKFMDAATGEVVLSSVVDGDVVLGIFGGDSDDAQFGVADEIMKVLKKANLVGDKMKKFK